MKSFLSATLIMLGMAIPAIPANAASVGPKLSTLNKGISDVNFKNVGTFQHQILLTGDISLVAKVGPLTISDVGYGNDKLTVKLPVMPFSAPTAIPVPNPASASQAIQLAKTWRQSASSMLTTRIKNWAASEGVSMGVYNFTQEVNIQTSVGVKKQVIFWNISVDKDGKAIYGEPKLVNADPLILEANYVTGTAMSGLPSNWRFDNGGKIQYRILDKKLLPLTAWQTVPVNNAFDSTSTSFSTAQANCLIDMRNDGCSQAASLTSTDIRSLMGTTGASFAYVNYVHGLVPEYSQEADGSESAKAAISVDERVWSCDAYINKGYFGFVLNTQLDRYFVEYDESAKLTGVVTGSFKGRAISPTEPYSKAVSTSALTGHPDGYIISPMPGDDSLWSRGDTDKMKSVIYVAPVRSGSTSDIVPIAVSAGDTTMTQSFNSGNVKRYIIGTMCDNCFHGGDGTQFDRTVTFGLSNPAALDRFAIVNAWYDDWLAVWVNGVMVMNRPFGGDRLELILTPYTYETNCSGKGSERTCMGTATGYNKSVRAWPGGSSAVEMQVSRYEAHNIDIKPYLVAGTNTIFMRTIVGGEGEGIIEVEINECGGQYGLPATVESVPASASFQGVTNTLVTK